MSDHAKIDEPLELRKEIMECAVISTDAINSEDNLKELNKQKKKLKTQLKNNLADLKKSIKQFEKLLPAIPQEEKMRAKREELRILMQNEMAEEMGGQIKPVNQIKRELDKIKGRDPKILKKKAANLSEREDLRRNLDDIRGRLSKLKNLFPEE